MDIKDARELLQYYALGFIAGLIGTAIVLLPLRELYMHLI